MNYALLRRYSWTAKDYAIAAVGIAVYLLTNLLLQKLIKNVDTKLLRTISLVAAAVVILVLVFMT
ncbi:MAG TPA: hypothetical protein P5092_00270 [Ruminococcus sp.]|nr:hypothetical protein [Ruminococcus sp.]